MWERAADEFVKGLASVLAYLTVAAVTCWGYYAVTGRNLLEVAAATLHKCLM